MVMVNEKTGREPRRVYNEAIMNHLRFVMTAILAAILSAALCLGQAAPSKKSYTFHGKVVSVNKETKALSVDGEEVKGWMGAMTMNYKVDNPAIIDQLKPGDHITATVYDGDYVLHNVKLDTKK
jgi:protein SCO1